jgi:hypothetical protein
VTGGFLIPMPPIRRRHSQKSGTTPDTAGAVTVLRQPRSAPVRSSVKITAFDGATDDGESAPAYVRECVAGWHVYNGRDEVCFTFAKSYDGCRLHGRMLVLCKRLLFAIEVIEFRWDEAAATFIEHRRYTDESPACGDGR